VKFNCWGAFFLAAVSTLQAADSNSGRTLPQIQKGKSSAEVPKKPATADQIFEYFSAGAPRKPSVDFKTGEPNPFGKFQFKRKTEKDYKRLTRKEIEEICGAPDEIRTSHPHRKGHHELWVWDRGGVSVTAALDVMGDELIPMQLWWEETKK
jgi:hypothetical protein